VAARLDDEDSEVCRAALDVLEAMGAEAAQYAGQVAARLEDENPWRRRAALDVLEAMGAGDLLEAMGAGAAQYAGMVAARLEDKDSWVRRAALAALPYVVIPQRILSVGPADHSPCVGTLYQVYEVAHAIAAQHLSLCCLATAAEENKLKLALTEANAIEHLSAFEMQQITAEDLPDLTKEDMRSIGIPLGPATRIYKYFHSTQRLGHRRP